MMVDFRLLYLRGVGGAEFAAQVDEAPREGDGEYNGHERVGPRRVLYQRKEEAKGCGEDGHCHSFQ